MEIALAGSALRPDLPIIMITTYGYPEMKWDLKKDTEARLTKPIHFGALRSEIDPRVGRAA